MLIICQMRVKTTYLETKYVKPACLSLFILEYMKNKLFLLIHTKINDANENRDIKQPNKCYVVGTGNKRYVLGIGMYNGMKHFYYQNKVKNNMIKGF